MTEQQERKLHIRAFMQANYTEERLAMLLAHCRDGRFNYYSCCCFIGIATATHALRDYLGCPATNLRSFVLYGTTLTTHDQTWDHYHRAQDLPGAKEAEDAVLRLGGADTTDEEDHVIRRRILIPMIRAEMKRRESQRSQPAPALMAEQEVLS